MKTKYLAVVVLLSSGCQQQAAPPERKLELELPSEPEKTSGEQATAPETPGEEPQTPPADAVPEQTWTVRSADGNVELQQTALRNGKNLRCTTRVTSSPPSGERSVVWQWDTCIATREQLKFISPDGKRVLVLEPSPAPIQGDWKDVEVVTRYEHGLRAQGLTAGAFLHELDAARAPSPGRFAWMKGARYASDGAAVELQTMDGSTLRLGFEGQARAPGLFQYVDDQGTRHFVASRGEVPARYHARAVPVEAEVGVVPASTSLQDTEPAPSGSKPEAPALPIAGKADELKAVLESSGVKNPTELVQKAREEAKKAEEVQRQKHQQLESLR